MRDLCPHRGIPLSYGWFDGEKVTCKYHGWSFEPVSGQCREIPSLTKADTLDPCRIFATAYPCEERDGHLWVYVPQSGRSRSPSSKEVLEGHLGAGIFRPFPKFQSSGCVFTRRISSLIFRATSITASSV